MTEHGNQDDIRVVHFTSCWLPQTMTWLDTHIRYLPEEFQSHVVCQWTQNLSQFPVARLSSLGRPPKTTTLLRRVQRRLGLWDDDTRTRALLEDVLRTSRPDVLHSHFGNCGWANSRLAQKHGVRHVVGFYGVDLSYLPHVDPRWISRYREMSDRIDAVLCEGPHMARCIANVGVEFSKIKLFRLGIDLSRIPYAPRANPAGSRGVRFLISGSFREKKGIPYALEALGLLAKKHPDIEISVIGDSGGSEREEAEKRKVLKAVEQHHLGSKTRFLGYVPYEAAIQEFYRHDVFVSPSVTSSDGDTEGGAPVTVIEAAATGMPVMSTTHCDIPFVLSKENGAYLAAERDAEGLSRSIERLLENPDWSSMVSANRRLVEQELDVQRQTLKLSDIYREVTGRQATASNVQPALSGVS